MKGRISSHVTFFKSCSIVSHRRHPATHWSTGTHTHRQSLVGCVRCSVGGSVGVSKHHYAWSLKNTSRLRYNPVNKEIENTPVTPEWEYSATSTRCSLQTAGEEVWNVGKCSVGLWCLLAALRDGALRLISRGTSHGKDNSTTHRTRALHCSTTAVHPPLLSAERADTNKEGGWRWKEGMNKRWSMIYERSLMLLFFPASLLRGKQCWFLWGNVCIVLSAYLTHAHKHSGRREPSSVYTLPLLPPPPPEIYLCWLLKRPSGVSLGHTGWT